MISNQRSSYNFNIKMHNKKVIFAFDMRIEKKILKLHVYDDDSLQDLIVRFSKAANLNERFHEKIKEKLERQFEKLLVKQNCSGKVKEKIEEFLYESKIVIIGVSETEVYEPKIQQTPLRMLDENFNQPTSKKQLIIYNQTPVVSKNLSKEIYVQQESESSRYDRPNEKVKIRQMENQVYPSSLRKQAERDQVPTYLAPPLQQIPQYRKNTYAKSSFNSQERSRPTSTSSYEAYKQQKSQKGSLQRRNESKQLTKPSITIIQQKIIQQKIMPSKSSKSIKPDYGSILDAKWNSESKGAAWGLKEAKKFNYFEQGKF